MYACAQHMDTNRVEREGARERERENEKSVSGSSDIPNCGFKR